MSENIGMKEFFKFLFDIISLSYFEKIKQSRCLLVVNTTIENWCDKIKQSEILLARTIIFSVFALMIVASLLIKVAIWKSLGIDFAEMLIWLFPIALVVGYHATNKGETTKQYIVRNLSKMTFPLLLGISCLILYLNINWGELYFIKPQIAIRCFNIFFVFLGCIIAIPMFKIIAYLISKTFVKMFVKYMQKKLSAKLIWNCVLSGIFILIYESITSFM